MSMYVEIFEFLVNVGVGVQIISRDLFISQDFS